jgi:hypothetical protein
MGLVADDASLYALTANGQFDSMGDYGDSALRLSPNLNVADTFTPCNQQLLDADDVDLASGGMLILPTQSSGPANLITFAGKEGSIYLVNRTAMGGYTPTTVADNVECTDNVVQKLWRVLGTASTTNSNRNAYWGAPAYFQDWSGRQYVYYTGDYSPIIEWDLTNGLLTAGTVPGGNANETARSEYNFAHGGTIPVISSNGRDPSTAVLWAIRRPLPPSNGTGTLTLDAYSATNLTNQLVFDIPAGSWTYSNDAFLIPTVVNGKVYVSSAGQVEVFGISTGSSPTATATPTPTPVPGAIHLSRNRVNFGKVKLNVTKTDKFRVHNVGKGVLHVTVGSLQPPFQVQGGGSITLSKGQASPPISVQFTPTTSGVVTPQTLTMSSDDPKHPSPSLTVSGIGK